MRFMQEMMELSSQQQKEQLPPRAVQIVSHPFFGRVVLTSGPAQFGTDLSKSITGVSVSSVCQFPMHGHLCLLVFPVLSLGARRSLFSAF